MSDICNAPFLHTMTNGQIQFAYNEFSDRFEPLSPLSPQQRRQWETRPELTPDTMDYWEEMACPYDDETLPPCCDVDPTTSAFLDLLDNFPNRSIETDLGVSADDVRSGRFGTLSRGALRELEKLDKNQDYRLVSRDKKDNDSRTRSMAWVPRNGGASIEIESSKNNILFPANGSELLQHIDLAMLIPTSSNEGISASELRAGKFGRLPHDITQSLESLQKDKDYALTTLFYGSQGEASYLAWVDKATGNAVVINQDNRYPMY